MAAWGEPQNENSMKLIWYSVFNTFFFFLPQSEVMKPASPQEAQLGFFSNFTSFIEMHLFEEPD